MAIENTVCEVGVLHHYITLYRPIISSSKRGNPTSCFQIPHLETKPNSTKSSSWPTSISITAKSKFPLHTTAAAAAGDHLNNPTKAESRSRVGGNCHKRGYPGHEKKNYPWMH
jgi:hypothetical protein